MKAEAFWRRFQEYEARLWLLDDDAMTGLQHILSQYDESLSYEISDEEDGVRDLIVSAGGDSTHFESVERLVGASPDLKRWNVIALSPPQGFDFVHETEDFSLNPTELCFDSLSSEARPNELGIRVFVPRGIPAEDAESAVYRIVMTAIGERKAATAISRLEVAPMPRDTSAYIPLRQLDEYVDWYLAKRAKTEPS